MQDVAYGVTNINYDSGDTQSVPHAILQCKYSHAIDYYLTSCEDRNVEPLSETTCWRILRAIKPSQKRLACLDDITAEGMNGFEFLKDTVKNII